MASRIGKSPLEGLASLVAAFGALDRESIAIEADRVEVGLACRYQLAFPDESVCIRPVAVAGCGKATGSCVTSFIPMT